MFSVNYVSADAPLVYDQTYKGPGASELTSSVDTRTITISDMRGEQDRFSLDKNGFEIVHFSPDFDAFEDDEAIKAHLYPEVIAMLKRKLNSDDVMIFDHTYRSTTRVDKSIHNRAPVKTVHNDYTEVSAHHRMMEETKGREHLRKCSYTLVNLWLPVHNKVESSPLAMVDITTVQTSDFQRLKLIYPDRIGEIAAITYNPKHKWFYQSDMTPDEGLLFKVFDSTFQEGMFGVPHSAVDVVEDASGKPRTSIELRAIVFSGGSNE